MFLIKIMIVVLMTKSINCLPINNSSIFNKLINRTLAKRALSYIANDTVCIIDNLIYQNGDPIPTDDPCESCKCRPPGFACVLRECDVKPGCKEIPVEGECCPSYQCAGCEHDGKFYKDGDIVPNPNKLFSCYRCKCKGSSIICGLMDCQFRYDCQSRYRPGECCPNYDHCDVTSTRQSFSNNQTLIASTKANSLNDLVSLDRTTAKQIRNSSPSLSTIPSTNNPPTTLASSDEKFSSTQSPAFVSSTQQSLDKDDSSPNRPDNELTETGNDAISDVNNDTMGDTTNDTNNELNRVDVFPPNKASEMVSNSSLQNKITQSLAASSEVTSLNSIQVDQIDKRIDEAANDEISNDGLKNDEISNDENLNDEIQSTTLTNLIRENVFQPLVTVRPPVSITGSTTIPNITDTTILAPNTSSIVNFITESSILKDESSKDKKDHDLDDLMKNDSSTEKDEFKVDNEEENLVKKLEDKLEEKLEEKMEKKSDEKVVDRVDDTDDEIRTPIELLKKVLDNCRDERCDSMEKLIVVTEEVLKDYDSRIVEKVKLTNSFEQLKNTLITNVTIQTENTIILNSTESGISQLDDAQYPTTIRYLRTSDLVAEHKDAEIDDLALEDDQNKTLEIF